MAEEPKKYAGKTVKVKARCIKRRGIPAGSVIAGRHVMTCCEADIQFEAFICNCADAGEPENDTWVILTAKMDYKFHRAYGRKGPVLTALSWEKTAPPEQPVATFY